MRLDEKFEILYDFFVYEFRENLCYLGDVLAMERKDDDCIQLLINIELYIEKWLKLFFGDYVAEVFEVWADSCIYEDGKNDKNVRIKMLYYKEPNEEEIMKAYNETSKIEFPFLNWKYVDKKIYKPVDNMIDNLFPNLKY